jgi:hypothetical protein
VFGLSFLEPTARVSPKISSPQPSRITRLSSQRPTNAHLIREQVITEFHTSTPNGSFEFQEVPSYLTLHNLSLPDISSDSNSESTSQSPSPISASTQHHSLVSPITMAAAPSTMPPRGHGSAPKFTPDVPRELQHYYKELELLFGPAQVIDDMVIIYTPHKLRNAPRRSIMRR